MVRPRGASRQTLLLLHADRLLLAVTASIPDIGLMSPDVLEAQLNAVMIQVSREVADSTEFQGRSLSVMARMDSVHKVITDEGVKPDMVAALKSRNIDVVIV
jgi:DeoR family transcriptional regulator of aga operon